MGYCASANTTQFVGADTAEEAIPLLRSLRAAKKGVLFAYSVEVDQKEATGASISSPSTDNTANSFSSPDPSPADNLFPYERILKEILHCIDVAADFEEGIASKLPHDSEPHGGRTWVAVKFTALVPDAHALIALSSRITESRKSLPKSSKHAVVPFPGSARIDDLDIILHPSKPKSSDDRIPLAPADIQQIQRLYADLSKICAHAREKGIKIIVDAEYRLVAINTILWLIHTQCASQLVPTRNRRSDLGAHARVQLSRNLPGLREGPTARL